jgi:tetratricopeptide (TPR) repeat protein
MFQKALAFHPNNANVHNNLGVTLLEMGDFKGAEKALQKALEIYPEHINARYNLGLALWSLGETERAIQEYRNIMKVKPNWAIVANSLAWVLATDQNPENRNGVEALKWAQVACEGEGGKNPEYLDTLAAAYAESGVSRKRSRPPERALNWPGRHPMGNWPTSWLSGWRYEAGRAYIEKR